MLKRFFPLFILVIPSLIFGSLGTLIVLPEARSEGITVNDPFISLIDRAKQEILMASYKLQKNGVRKKCTYIDCRSYCRGS